MLGKKWTDLTECEQVSLGNEMSVVKRDDQWYLIFEDRQLKIKLDRKPYSCMTLEEFEAGQENGEIPEEYDYYDFCGEDEVIDCISDDAILEAI